MAGSRPFDPFLGISNFLLMVLIATTKSEFCGNFFEAQVDHALVGHVKGRSTVTSDFECLQKCIRKISCKSCNVHLNGTYTSRTCELNNQTQHTRSSDFMRKEGSTYYGIVQVSCNPGFHKDNTTKNVPSSHEGSLAPVLGWNSSFPAQSCKHILDVGGSKGNGEYWIDPGRNGSPLKVYCDMKTDGGGWLLIYNVVIDNSRPPTSLDIETSYTGISRYKNGKMVVSPDGLRQLRKNLSFTQLRFHCRKQYHRRTFHVKTAANSSGQAVVRFFSGDTDVLPKACGSFEKLQGDNSELAGRCTEWGKEKTAYYVGKWGHEGHKALHLYSAFILSTYYWITWPDYDRWECDDALAKHVSTGDFWKIYVR